MAKSKGSENASVSVVIVSYHTGPILSRNLESVLLQEGLEEVILVDNGNPEDVRKRLQELQKEEERLTLMTGQGNVGFAKGCNLGAAQAKGDYLLLLNPDCILPERALVDMVEVMEAHPDAWLASCRMVQPDGSLQIGNKRNLLTPQVAFTQALRLHKLDSRFMPMNLSEDPNETEASYVPAISGAFMMMKREKYIEIGGMDEAYFFHVEDLDLCLKINQLGGKVLYVPKVKTIHYRSSSKVSNFFVERHKTDGFIRYFTKHYKFDLRYGHYYVLILAIYIRLLLRIPILLLRKFHQGRRQRIRAIKEMRQQRLLRKPYAENILLDNKEKTAWNEREPVLLVGATGQVGLNILRRLLANDIETYALYHQQAIDYRHDKLMWVQGDMATGVWNVKNVQPKTLIHTPAVWYLPEHLEAFAKMGVTRLVCFSSTSIMGKSETKNRYEQDMLRKFVQAEEDIASECKRLGIEWTIFRPTMIYGSGLDHNVSSIVRFIQSFGFFPIAMPGAGLRQPVHADDLAGAVMAAMNNKDTFGKTYNLCGGSKVSYQDMVGQIFDTIGRKNRTIRAKVLPHLLDGFSWITGRKDINGEIAKRMNSDLVFDDSSARQDFGYAPRDFLSGGSEDLGLVQRAL